MLRKEFSPGSMVVALLLTAGLAGNVSAQAGPLPSVLPTPGPASLLPPRPYPPQPWYSPWTVVVPVANDPIVPTWQTQPQRPTSPPVDQIPTMPTRVILRSAR